MTSGVWPLLAEIGHQFKGYAMQRELNKDYIAWHLQEAAKEIASILKEMEADPEWEIGSFSVGMRHLFHHAKSAWNARNASESEASACSEENFEKWRQYPTDLEMI